MTLMQTPVCDYGRPVIDFCLEGIDGKKWSLADCQGEKGLLVMFICNHCPYVKSIQERLVRDTNELAELGINSVAIMPNDSDTYAEDSFENMQRVAKKYAYQFPYLIDASQAVAKAYGAICTPDFFGYNQDLQLQYRGRLDSSGMQASDNAERELFLAMQEIAKTGKGPSKQIASMGCSIKWTT